MRTDSNLDNLYLMDINHTNMSSTFSTFPQFLNTNNNLKFALNLNYNDNSFSTYFGGNYTSIDGISLSATLPMIMNDNLN